MAFMTHLLTSILIALLLAYIVFMIWYPVPLPKATGITHIFLMMLIIDVILGPILTFIIYKKGKKTLKIDLAVIIILQLGAMLYGMYFVAQGRPSWLVQIEDRVILVSPSIALDEKNQSISNRFYLQHWGKPIIASVEFSKNAKVYGEQVILDAMGQGVVYQPYSYQPYNTENALKKAKDLSGLNQYNNPNSVKEILSNYPNAKFWLPLRGADFAEDLVVLLDERGNVLSIVELKPWSS